MTTATVRSAAEHIARSGVITPQQLAAFSGLDEGLTAAQKQAFTDLWRADGSPAAPPVYDNTWAGVTAAAKLVGAKYPELVAAQWALESGFGKKVSGRHNYFGLKGKGTTRMTTELVNGARVHVEAEFLDFSDLLACVRHLVDKWHLDYSNYKGANNATSRNEGAKWLLKEGYATDPTYADKLIRLMGEHAPKSAPKPKAVISVAAAQQQQPAADHRHFLLNVPYEAQNDNASGTGYRECFSSSAAMVARYYGKITNDDAYNKFRAKYGDTTDSVAQVNALKALALNARFITNCTVALLEAELDASRPVLVGWLHKGPVSAPTGGGHWSVVIGYSPTAFIHNDPNGEANLVQGGYVNTTKGKTVTYSRKNWLKRWLVEGPNSGWALLVGR
jgi:hypothetical protein